MIAEKNLFMNLITKSLEVAKKIVPALVLIFFTIIN